MPKLPSVLKSIGDLFIGLLSISLIAIVPNDHALKVSLFVFGVLWIVVAVFDIDRKCNS